MKKLLLKFSFVFLFVTLISIVTTNNVFASDVTTEEISNTTVYNCNNAKSNIKIKLDGNEVYSVIPLSINELRQQSQSIFVLDDSEKEYKICYILTKKRDYSITQAAIWKVLGFNVTLANSSDYDYAEELVQEANAKLEDFKNSPSYIFSSNFLDDSDYLYDVERDEYVGKSFNVGKYDLVERYYYEGTGYSTYVAYFEKLVDGKFVKIDDVIISNGTYRIVLPRKAIKYTQRAGFEICDEKTYYLLNDFVNDDLNHSFIAGWRGLGGVLRDCEIEMKNIYLDGDLNFDKLVNSSDAALALDLFKNNNATKMEYNVGDLNNDNQLSSSDAALILDIFKNSNKVNN